LVDGQRRPQAPGGRRRWERGQLARRREDRCAARHELLANVLSLGRKLAVVEAGLVVAGELGRVVRERTFFATRPCARGACAALG
jgi:hypothetical protein